MKLYAVRSNTIRSSQIHPGLNPRKLKYFFPVNNEKISYSICSIHMSMFYR